MKSTVKFLIASAIAFGLLMPLISVQAGGGNNADGNKVSSDNGVDQERGHKGKKNGHAE